MSCKCWDQHPSLKYVTLLHCLRNSFWQSENFLRKRSPVLHLRQFLWWHHFRNHTEMNFACLCCCYLFFFRIVFLLQNCVFSKCFLSLQALIQAKTSNCNRALHQYAHRLVAMLHIIWWPISSSVTDFYWIDWVWCYWPCD